MDEEVWRSLSQLIYLVCGREGDAEMQWWEEKRELEREGGLSGLTVARFTDLENVNDWREWSRRREERSRARLESNRLMYG